MILPFERMPTPTPAQKLAIETATGPVLVIAGPGAGKTFCLIERIGHLVEQKNFRADRILAVTFTNKAAEEIAVRLSDRLGGRAHEITRGTLHSRCADILREFGGAVGAERGFGIADETYARLILRRLGVYRHSHASRLLNLFTRRRLSDAQLSRDDEQLFQEYRRYLERRNLLDFDDLIAKTRSLLREHRSITAQLAGRFDYVLVDEFQDLNPAQYAILKELAGPHRNFFAVGDEEQSIFSWTGADPSILRQFADEFGIKEPIVLDQNRRCSVQIFEAARRLLSTNEPLFAQKDITANRTSEHEVRAYSFSDDRQEAAWIIRDLRRDQQASGADWGSYALLYRTHDLGGSLESALVEAGIPCRMARGRSLRDDPVIRYVAASLRLMRDPTDPLLVEALAEILLPNALVDEIRRAQADGDREFLPTVQEMARRRQRADPDRAKLWRFTYEVQNLEGIYQMQPDLPGIVSELLSRRVGEYTNVLEEHHDVLSDPAQNPRVAELADRLSDCLAGRNDVIVPSQGGMGIAVRGLLWGGGITTASMAENPTARSESPVVVDADPLTVFKALQLLHGRELGSEFRDYVAFDLETTDQDANSCEIVEIGAVRVRDGSVVDEFHSLVRPKRAVSPEATKVHGYTERDLVQAPTFPEIWPRFREFVRSDLLVAHNGIRFDVPVLKRMAQGLPNLDTLVFYDSYPLARDLLRSSHRLPDLAHRFQIDTGRSHHALDDARTLAAVFAELGRLKRAHARKTALVNLLDWLAVGLALEPVSDPTPEWSLLRRESRIYALGRYSDVLDRYEAERSQLGDPSVPPVEELVRRLGGKKLMERLRVEKSAEQRYPETVARLEKIMQVTRGKSLEQSVESFLERLTLTTSEGVDVDPHRVNLLTLHSTKGLEFSTVYIVGVEDYQIPGYYPTVDHRIDEIEEARRLLYVGMTRAEDRLVLTCTRNRSGSASGGHRFLDEAGLETVDGIPERAGRPEVTNP